MGLLFLIAHADNLFQYESVVFMESAINVVDLLYRTYAIAISNST